jgi:hypothetical protein
MEADPTLSAWVSFGSIQATKATKRTLKKFIVTFRATPVGKHDSLAAHIFNDYSH